MFGPKRCAEYPARPDHVRRHRILIGPGRAISYPDSCAGWAAFLSATILGTDSPASPSRKSCQGRPAPAYQPASTRLKNRYPDHLRDYYEGKAQAARELRRSKGGMY